MFPKNLQLPAKFYKLQFINQKHLVRKITLIYKIFILSVGSKVFLHTIFNSKFFLIFRYIFVGF